MRKAIVTGGAGFVGSHVVEVLLERGYEVAVVDRAYKLAPKEILYTQPIDFVGAELIVHAAAHADISANWTKPGALEDLWSDNIDATWTLLRNVIAGGSCKRFVFLSTCAVYGDGGPHRERDACVATSPYAATKLAGEAMVQAWARKMGWRWHVARLVSCVGARYSHGHVADFVRKAKSHGKRFDAKDNGEQKKSFVHVRDAAEAIAELAAGDVPEGVYNVTSAERWGWRDTASIMGVTPKPNPHRAAGWVGDPVDLHVDGSKLGQYWQPRRRVADGVREALEGLGWER